MDIYQRMCRVMDSTQRDTQIYSALPSVPGSLLRRTASLLGGPLSSHQGNTTPASLPLRCCAHAVQWAHSDSLREHAPVLLVIVSHIVSNSNNCGGLMLSNMRAIAQKDVSFDYTSFCHALQEAGVCLTCYLLHHDALGPNYSQALL